MKGIRSAFLIGLACCLAATSGLARTTSAHGKSTRAEKSARASGKKSRSTAAKARKSKPRAESAKRKGKEPRISRMSESERLLSGFSDLPPEDLPEPEEESDGDQP